MEVKEVIKFTEPESGRSILLHVTENELREIVQAGMMTLLSTGYIALKTVEGAELAANPTDATIN